MAQAIIEAYGTVYGAGDVLVTIGQRTLIGIDKIKYGDKQVKKNITSMSRLPVARGLGNVEFESGITLKSFELDALQAASPTGNLRDLRPFNIQITYLDADLDIIKNDTIIYAEFTGETREIKGGDTEVTAECELIIGDIQRNT